MIRQTQMEDGPVRAKLEDKPVRVEIYRIRQAPLQKYKVEINFVGSCWFSKEYELREDNILVIIEEVSRELKSYDTATRVAIHPHVMYIGSPALFRTKQESALPEAFFERLRDGLAEKITNIEVELKD